MSLDSRAPSHFKHAAAGGDLRQGDILEISGPLEALIASNHHQHMPSTCSHGIVLTQCCDLVRGRGMKTKDLALAPLVPLTEVLDEKLAREQTEFGRSANVCSESKKPKLAQFLTDLLNNNNHELFYIHKEEGFGLFEPQCALLRQSLSVPCEAAYGACIEARIFSLKEPWRAKLGWLVGNIYSRVGTPDWTDEVPNAQFKHLIEGMLTDACHWVPSDKLQAAEAKAHPPFDNAEVLRDLIDNTTVKTASEKVLEIVERAIQQVRVAGVDKSLIKSEIVNALKADVSFQTILRRR